MIRSATPSRTLLLSALLLALLVLLVAARDGAQTHTHAGSSDDGLGEVHFATSCRADVAPQFDRAIALLHSFEFGPAIRGFTTVASADTTCAMAFWGIALARWTNPMAAGNRAPALLAQGRAAVDSARKRAPNATPRERAYIDAVAALYDDYEHRDQRTRVARYAAVMGQLAEQQPADTEAKIFHAIALVAAASPTDKTYAAQRQAGAVLEPLWAAQPDHPGLAHYIIHTYDVPALASLAERAAQRYAAIAPSAAHAQHMPSHTFTRLGMWDASITANLRSRDVALRDSSMGEVLHASDYIEYAYLQLQRDADARRVRDELPAIAARFDPNVIGGAAPGSAGVFALAAIPARYTLERRAWSEAASLVPASTAFPYADAMTWFARALGNARLGHVDAACAATDTLGAIHDRLAARNEAYWAEQVAIQRLGALGWTELAAGHREAALTAMREAATREDATEKNAVTPGPLAPARELLGDMLLQLGQPADALAEYRRTLAKEPHRLHALEGEKQASAAIAKR